MNMTGNSFGAAGWATSLPLWSAAAIVAAAIVAALVGLFGHWVARSNARLQAELGRELTYASNEQAERNSRLQTQLAANLKLAEFRQAWINNLRDDMAKFQSFGITPGLDQAKEQEFYRLGTRIELFMNPDDEDFCRLQDALYDFLNAETLGEKYGANPEFVQICQRILKREWDVLKEEIKSVASLGGGQTS
jgi:hypothetical protein